MTALIQMVQQLELDQPQLEIVLTTIASQLDILNANLGLASKEPVARLSEKSADNALDALNLASRVVLVKALRFAEDQNSLTLASARTQCCRLGASANQTIANNTNTVVTFDTELFDTDDMHDLTTNNSRITFNTAGVYLIGGRVRYATSGAGTTRQIQITINGTASILDSMWVPPSAAIAVRPGAVTIYQFVRGDYIEMLTLQDSGGNLDIQASVGNVPQFWAHRLS